MLELQMQASYNEQACLQLFTPVLSLCVKIRWQNNLWLYLLMSRQWSGIKWLFSISARRQIKQMLKSQFSLLGVWDVVITANDLHVWLKQSYVIWVQQRVELHNQLRQFPSWEQRVVGKRPESHMGQNPQSWVMRTYFHVTVRCSLLNRVLHPDLLYLRWGNTQHVNHFVVSLGTEVTLSERLETGC